MDKIEFITRMSSVGGYQVVDIFINGFNLINIISTEEQSIFPLSHVSAYPGTYEGVQSLHSLPPKQHFWGIANPAYQIADKRVAVLESGRTGVPSKWTVSVEILVNGEEVVWQKFRQEQLSLDYKPIGPFVFELVAYSRALRQEGV